MRTLNIPASRTSPAITFDDAGRRFSVIGNAIPENAGEFFSPILQWLKEHLQELPPDCLFEFDLPYFNSSSLKAIYLMLMEIKKGVDQGLGFRTIWYVEENDDFMQEAGETFQEMVGMAIQIEQGRLKV